MQAGFAWQVFVVCQVPQSVTGVRSSGVGRIKIPTFRKTVMGGWLEIKCTKYSVILLIVLIISGYYLLLVVTYLLHNINFQC